MRGLIDMASSFEEYVQLMERGQRAYVKLMAYDFAGLTKEDVDLATAYIKEIKEAIQEGELYESIFKFQKEVLVP